MKIYWYIIMVWLQGDVVRAVYNMDTIGFYASIAMILVHGYMLTELVKTRQNGF